MEQLQHFSHDHLLSLVHMQPQDKHESSDDEDGDGDGDDFVVEDQHGGKCNMCKEHIYSFHLCYYECKECDYSLHKFCAQLPKTLQNHSLHPGHNLTLSEGFQGPDPYFLVSGGTNDWKCNICNLRQMKNVFNYHCSMCQFSMDIICATISEQKMDHPCHPHQLERMFKPMTANCNACEKKHTGTFYYCNTCQFSIHLDCALLPKKLLIQQPTNETFTHSHPLTLAYSFPYINLKAKFFPRCRVCNDGLSIFSWLYRCEKCQYYVHVNCATSKTEPFMSIFLRASLGKTLKNFDDDKHPNLLNCPFPDESYSLLKHLFVNEKDFIDEGNNGKILNYHGHQHPLILFETQTSLGDKSSFLHNPMTKCQLLCDGCVKPIVTVPFYKCSQHVEQCGFVLHTWCATLPSEVQDHPGHPKHTLTLMRNIPAMFFDVFWCGICWLPSNGFAYGCMTCGYYVDINCAFIPEKITHEAHPNHLLSRMIFSATISKRYCHACKYTMKKRLGFYCQSCDFYLHTKCALFLPRMIRHKYDKHPLSLRYYPVENHISEYFCEICEDEINPRKWFYHCTMCVWSMHAACGPIILQCEQAAVSRYKGCVFEFLNVKFGRTLKIKGHPHHLSFVQGVERDGLCNKCHKKLQFSMIFKCFKCEFALHYVCARRSS